MGEAGEGEAVVALTEDGVKLIFDSIIVLLAIAIENLLMFSGEAGQAKLPTCSFRLLMNLLWILLKDILWGTEWWLDPQSGGMLRYR